MALGDPPVVAGCGTLPNRAEYLAPGGLGNDQWLVDYYAYINCLNAAQSPALSCPAGYVWEGSVPPNGGCLPIPATQQQADQNNIYINGGLPFPVTTTGQPPASVAPPVVKPPTVTPPKITPPVVTPPVVTPPSTTPPALQPHFLGGGAGGDYCDLFPDDPYCSFWGDLGGLFGGTTSTVVQNIIYQTGLVAADVHDIVDQALTGLWNVTVVTLDLVLGGIVSGIQNALTSIGNALKAVWNILSRLSGLILTFLKNAWNLVISNLLRALHDIAGVLKDLYTKVLKPLLVSMQALRQKLLDVYKRFVRPVLIILQDIRKVLSILAIFHVPFAAKLDRTLADLERRLTAPLLLLLRFSNAIANWINLVITAGYLLQRSIFLNSLKAYVGSSINLQLNAMTKPLGAADLAQLHAGSTAPTTAQASSAAVEYLQTGTGINATVANQQRDAFAQYLSAGF